MPQHRKRQSAKPTEAQCRILRILSENPKGLTRSKILSESGIGLKGLSAVLGPVYEDNIPSYPDSLWARKWVDPVMGPDDREPTYYLTPAGNNAAQRFRVIGRRVGTGVKVPHEVLAGPVRTMMKTRAYGLEFYTDEDIRELRDKLSERDEKYATVEIDALRNQIVGARKAGAFKERKIVHPWYQDYLESPHWQERRQAALTRYGHRCVVNRAHSKDVEVYHRSIANLGSEDTDDCVCLCKRCHTKLADLLCEIPPEPPY